MQPPLHRVVIEFTHDRLKEMCTNAGNFEMYDKLCTNFDNQGLKDLLDIINAEVSDQKMEAYNEGYSNAQYNFTED